MQVRPSAIAGIVACPGRLRMSADAPAWIDEYGDSTVREEGNACHWLAHQYSKGVYPALGTLADNGVAITEDMQQGAQSYLQAVRSFGCSHLRFEHPVVIPAISANCSGTPDAAGVGMGNTGRPFVLIGDLKFGYRIVEAWPNYQLISYATGIAQLMGWNWPDFDVVMGIVQPRKWHQQGQIRFVVKTGEEVAKHVAVIRDAVAQAEGSSPELRPGDQCDWCPGRARCPAADKKVSQFAFDMPNDLNTAQAEQELQRLMAHQALVNARITGLSAQVDHAAKSGERLSRFERVSTTGALAWNDADIPKVRALSDAFGGKLVKQPELITPTQAKKVLPAAVVDQYARRVQGAYKLVPADPSRWVKRFSE